MDECTKEKSTKVLISINDATSGQIGEELRPESSTTSNINEQRMKASRKMSRDL